MKNPLKLSTLALVLAASISACRNSSKPASEKKPDSAAKSTITKVTDTIPKSTTGKVVGKKRIRQ